MNKAEKQLREDGYRYTGIYEISKEKLKKRAEEERAKGFLVRTLDYSLYAKYKALKPAEIEKAKESYKATNLALAANKSTLTNLEKEMEVLRSKINDVNREIYMNQREVEQLRYKLKDSGVPAEEVAASV